MENILTTNGTTTAYYDTTNDWWNQWWNTGIVSYSTSFYSDYRIENNKNELIIKILAAGVDKNDIKAYIEDVNLHVESKKSEYTDINLTLNLGFYAIDYKKPSVELRNGVLTIKFPKKEKKLTLEIK